VLQLTSPQPWIVLNASDRWPWEEAMRTFVPMSRATQRLGRLRLADLSKGATLRLSWFDWCGSHGGNVSLTCRHFGISRSTFYTWKQRYNPRDLRTLEDRSSRPLRCRQKSWTTDEVLAVLGLRKKYPFFGKAKLKVLLERQGMRLSASKVGRILSHLKKSWQLVEPLRRVSSQHRSWQRVYARRKPREYIPIRPGDIIQLDTVDIRPVPGVILKQFTAVDVVSRWSVALLARDATAASARRALGAIRARMPFPVRAIQVDGGSEFMNVFEEAVRDAGIDLFLLPPRSPKLNGRVERANRTYREEFYDYSTADPTVTALSVDLRRWERWYNHSRPHQSLAYQTPREFLVQIQPEVYATS
jgi:transposase InsO family protein